MAFFITYDYAALHALLKLERDNKPKPASDEEMMHAAQVLAPLEFEIFKLCTSADHLMKRAEIVDYLIENDIAPHTTPESVRELCHRIRQKGLRTPLVGHGGPRKNKRDLRILELLGQGVSYQDISERLDVSPKCISVLTCKLRKKYKQFHLSSIAEPSPSIVL